MKMRFVALLLASFSSLSLVQASAPPTSVPVVPASAFAVGHAWTWEYREGNGSLYSTERYTVVGNQRGVITLEMSTELAGEASFKAHHRLEVVLADCLAAYRNRVQKQAWTFRMFYLQDGQWSEIAPLNTGAFEEKFNCNPYVEGAGEPYKTLFATEDGHAVFRQDLWGKIPESWFLMNGKDLGVAQRRDFDSDPATSYIMRLVSSTQP